uniref:Uncharacterized protein n=1 Tax=Hucho hucho TaxID=62062 RepID=A0A4W5PAK4_9TELE
MPHLSSGKAVLTNVVSPIPSGACVPRITRSNSIPTNDAAFDLYGSSPLGSSLSLADRPKSMMRSGSFRDREPADDCETASTFHGSVLSLASNASSNYSSTEERIQGEQIRKLRRELENSQEKVANLTTQLSANANLVAAFEQSLQLMTSRLQSLSVSQEQKVPVNAAALFCPLLHPSTMSGAILFQNFNGAEFCAIHLLSSYFKSM